MSAGMLYAKHCSNDWGPCACQVGISTGTLPATSAPLALSPPCGDATPPAVQPDSGGAPVTSAEFFPLSATSVAPGPTTLPYGCEPIANGSAGACGSPFWLANKPPPGQSECPHTWCPVPLQPLLHGSYRPVAGRKLQVHGSRACERLKSSEAGPETVIIRRRCSKASRTWVHDYQNSD